ncbi:mitochondrial ribosomal subunit protein-domain-containing protein [Umbelopsis sp. PMI_123]|nr:mitochondrial ribosomal subunit protein-domain-containing protein [Umbelopsis sp. PMI_123]
MNTLILGGQLSRFTTKVGITRALSSSAVQNVGRQRPGRRSEHPFDVDNMEKFNFDDQTTIGHELFDNIREVRSYLRKAKYEIPKLSEHAKPFVPPNSSQILRFKTQNYMGEPHPVESKCVLNVKVDLLGLTDQERHKLLVLSGPRYNPETGELTLSSEKFPYVKQNKKYLSDLLDKLIVESKDTSDTFADIPLDTRHVKSKKKLEFPAEWARPKKTTPASS